VKMAPGGERPED